MNTHPIATLHYTEVLHSVIDKLPIIKRIPRTVTWPVSSTPYELASCDVCGSWDATKRVMDMLIK